MLSPPPTSYSLVERGTPFSMRHVFAVVPPMSNEMRLGMPRCRPNAAAPITPAAGPDSIEKTGRFFVKPVRAVPPLDCITVIGATTPMPASRRSRFVM